MAKKNAVPTPLVLAHAARKKESARVAKMTPAERTKEIAPQYVTRAIHAIRKVGVLGSAKTVEEKGDEKIYRAKFQLSKEHADKIIATLTHEVNNLRERLVPPPDGVKKTKTEFTF